MWKVEKERASLTEDDREVSTESVQASEDILWDPSDPRTERKGGDMLLLVAKAFGLHGRMDFLCLYQKPK